MPSLSSSGQNESGVAVHDDRIYVVGGYSIWTNEPLACIQVSLQSKVVGLLILIFDGKMPVMLHSAGQ